MMVYSITEYTTTGMHVRTLTTTELKARAKEGDIRAIKELISLKGGWSELTPAQKEKAMELILGFPVDL